MCHNDRAYEFPSPFFPALTVRYDVRGGGACQRWDINQEDALPCLIWYERRRLMIAKIKNFPSEKEGEGKMGAFYMRILFRDLNVRMRIPRSLSLTLFRIPIRATHTPLSLSLSFLFFSLTLTLIPSSPFFPIPYSVSVPRKREYSPFFLSQMMMISNCLLLLLLWHWLPYPSLPPPIFRA